MLKQHRTGSSAPQLDPIGTSSDLSTGSENSVSLDALCPDGHSTATPVLDAVGDEIPPKSYATGPLQSALDKRGKVTYVDPKHGKGDNKRDFEVDEAAALRAGDEDIDVASCSPFTYWCLANADKRENPDKDGSILDMPLDGRTNVRHVVNCESPARRGVDDLQGNDADWFDLIEGNVASDDQWRGHGVAGAVDKGDLGFEVTIDEAKPGDLCQTWEIWLSKGEKVFGGHSTQVHRVHAKGDAWFGMDGAPLLESVDPTCDTFRFLLDAGVCDADGNLLKQPEEPVWVEGCTFRMDEWTNPRMVGEHTSMTTELIGAHNGGINADTGKEDSGVFTRQAEDLRNKDNAEDGVGAERVHLARLDESAWAKWTPADQGSWIMPMPIRPAEAIQIQHDIPQLMDIAPALPEQEEKGRWWQRNR